MAKKSQKKPNSIKILVGVMIALLVIAAVAFTVLRITGSKGPIQQSALRAERERIKAENEEAELVFNAKLAQSASQTVQDDQPIAEEPHETWSATLGENEWTIEDMKNVGLENASTATLTRSELMNGGLLLVNPWHSLPSDFNDEALLSVGSTSGYNIQVDNSNVKLFPPAYSALEEALNAAKNEAGLEHYIVREGYRSVSDQEEMFNARMTKLSSKYSGERLVEETKKDVNYPGTSDYHSGMSFRLDVWEKNNTELNNKKFQAESEQGAWMTENCWKYGIIFRFPSVDFPNSSWVDKSYKTGVSSQINLYRYVGKAHSTVMRAMDFCLEDYIEFLIDHPHLCVYENGNLKYEIVRIKGIGAQNSFDLPVSNMASSYQASLDNMDGIVLAYTYQ